MHSLAKFSPFLMFSYTLLRGVSLYILPVDDLVHCTPVLYIPYIITHLYLVPLVQGRATPATALSMLPN